MLKRLFSLPLFQTVNGRQAMSLWASKLFEKSGIKRVFGRGLVEAVIITSVVTPQAQDLR